LFYRNKLFVIVKIHFLIEKEKAFYLLWWAFAFDKISRRIQMVKAENHWYTVSTAKHWNMKPSKQYSKIPTNSISLQNKCHKSRTGLPYEQSKLRSWTGD
jgi:hypothetical protein